MHKQGIPAPSAISPVAMLSPQWPFILGQKLYTLPEWTHVLGQKCMHKQCRPRLDLQYFMHILSPVTDNCPSWISLPFLNPVEGEKVCGQTGYRTQDLWLMSQVPYRLHYAARPGFQWNLVIVSMTWRKSYTKDTLDYILPMLWPFVSFSHFINRSSCLRNSSKHFLRDFGETFQLLFPWPEDDHIFKKCYQHNIFRVAWARILIVGPD